MTEFNLTSEASQLFKYIENILSKEFPSNNFTIEYFLLSIFENEECIAYQLLSKTMLNMSINVMHEWYVKYLTDNCKNYKHKEDASINYVTLYDDCLNHIIDNKKGNVNINSGEILISIMQLDEKVEKSFNVVGVTINQLVEKLSEIDNNMQSEKNDNTIQEIKEMPQPIKINKKKYNDNTDVDKHLTNLNKLSELGKITSSIGNEKLYKNIFNIFSKKNKNNIVLVGDSGVGKTCIAKNIANLLNENLVPKPFIGKQLMELNFMSLVSNTGFKGVFESKFKTIVDDAKKRGCYIFFVDDIHTVLSENSRFGEVNLDKMLDEILSENSIQFICTTNHKGYNNYIAKNPILKRQFQKITINEPNDKQLHDILSYHAEVLGKYHNVTFSDECIDDCLKLSKRYITEFKLPDSAIDVLDETAAIVSLGRKPNEEIVNLEKELEDVQYEKSKIANSSECDYDKTDELTKKEIKLKSKIAKLEKNDLLNNNSPLPINTNNIKETISNKTSIPITDLTTKEKESLKNINDKIKKLVIGQDNAVDNVCKIVKRQRLGLSSPNKPSVLFFAGSTGTGKTYLAKCLAKEIFGSENNLVRLDMSEYVDKMSVNKLYGSAAGYIGYDNGGILTNAIKKNKHCVLLLDEIEKANEDVHNVFLQLFDEGRLTDNLGEVVDFKNVIIIMTSNVGAKEASERGKQIGFMNNHDISNDIISKELRHKFKPEFLNRIDSIVYFNKLTDENIKNIIKLEILKLKERIENIGYKFSDNMVDNDVIDLIYNKIDKCNNFGARPIVREIQRNIEDKLTDYLIDNDVENGFVFDKDIII